MKAWEAVGEVAVISLGDADDNGRSGDGLGIVGGGNTSLAVIGTASIDVDATAAAAAVVGDGLTAISLDWESLTDLPEQR